jgi:hypothetical protein
MFLRRITLAALALATIVVASRDAAAELDIRRLAPSDAHTIAYAKHNPERDYQGKYLAEAYETFRSERICERIFEIISSRAPEEELAKFKAGWEEVEKAVEPIELEALVNAKEFLVANTMVGPFSQVLFAVRLSEEDAEDYRNGVGNLFELVQKWSGDEATAVTGEADGAETTKLQFAEEEIPFQPCAASVEDIFIVSLNADLLARCVKQLSDESATTKFDDPRFKEALSHLPEAEDCVTFFDGRQLFTSLKGLGDFIRNEVDDDDEDAEHAERAADIIEKVIDEIDILEYEVVVEYTEEGQNRSSTLGRVADDIEDSFLGRAVSGGEAFEDWQSWVPADATAYSLSTGIDLHEIYAGVIEFVREEVPESHEPLDEWDALQKKVGVNLDEDLLKSFSGENVSITLPNDQSVTALKCNNESKVRELLDRAIEGLKQIPQVQQQDLDLVDSEDEDLEGFQEFRAAALAMTPAKPVIGFRDGWMIIASTPEAAKKMLAVRAGEADSIAKSDSLETFNLKVDGEVYGVSYSDIGAGIRAVADGIDQAAMMAPMIVGMAAQGASSEDQKTIQQVIGLLPSASKVIRKFDFYEQKLTILREGPEEATYVREAVTLIRQPSDN